MEEKTVTHRPAQLNVELVDVYPTSIGHCPHFNFVTAEFKCLGGEFQTDQLVEYPEHVVESHTRLAETITRIKEVLKEVPVNVTIHLVEATSLKGVIKCFRHRLRTQSAVIVNGKKICDGYPFDSNLERLVQQEVNEQLKSPR